MLIYEKKVEENNEMVRHLFGTEGNVPSENDEQLSYKDEEGQAVFGLTVNSKLLDDGHGGIKTEDGSEILVWMGDVNIVPGDAEPIEPTEKPEAEVDGEEFESFKDAVAASAGKEVTLLKNISLDTAIDVTASMTINLGGHTIKPESSCKNGSAFNIKSGTVNIKNGTIDGTGVVEQEGGTTADHVGIDDGICLITVRSGAELVIDSNVTLIVNSKNGCCIYPFNGGKVTISNGTFKNLTTEDYQYRTGFKGLTLNQANISTQLIFVSGGKYYGNDPALGDDKDATFIVDGFVSENKGDHFEVVKE